MANTHVFTGAHGKLTLAPLDTPEGKDADSIVTAYETQAVGRVTDVQICVQTELEEFHEVGRRYPTSLHPGNIHISGKAGRAYINGALVGLLLGRQAFITVDPDNLPTVQPAFNMTVRLKDPATKKPVSAEIVLNGVQFENWSYNLPEDDFVLEEVTFKALSLDIRDAEDTVTLGPVFEV